MTVFLSYSSKDKEFVRLLNDYLNEKGILIFLDERDIAIEEDIPKWIYKSIEEASHICYIISKNSISSQWVQDELSTAKMIEKEKMSTFIVPILIDDVELPISVRSKRYADFRNQKEQIDDTDSSTVLLLKALGFRKFRIRDNLSFELRHFAADCNYQEAILWQLVPVVSYLQILVREISRMLTIEREISTSSLIQFNVEFTLYMNNRSRVVGNMKPLTVPESILSHFYGESKRTILEHVDELNISINIESKSFDNLKMIFEEISEKPQSARLTDFYAHLRNIEAVYETMLRHLTRLGILYNLLEDDILKGSLTQI